MANERVISALKDALAFPMATPVVLRQQIGGEIATQRSSDVQVTDEDFVFFTIPRNDPGIGEHIDRLLDGKELSGEEETANRHLLTHLSGVVQLPEVKGITLQDHPEKGIRLVCLVDSLAPNNPETNRVMSTVEQAGVDFFKALGLRNNFTFGLLREDETVEDFVERTREPEKADFRTFMAIKIE